MRAYSFGKSEIGRMPVHAGAQRQPAIPGFPFIVQIADLFVLSPQHHSFCGKRKAREITEIQTAFLLRIVTSFTPLQRSHLPLYLLEYDFAPRRLVK